MIRVRIEAEGAGWDIDVTREEYTFDTTPATEVVEKLTAQAVAAVNAALRSHP